MGRCAGTPHRPRRLFVDYYETTLAPARSSRPITVPPAEQGTALAALKFLSRSRDDYATVDVAVRLRLDGDAIADIRIALGSVGPTVRRASEAEAALVGASLERRLRPGPAGALAADSTEPESDVRGSADYKRELVRVLVRGRSARRLARSRRPGAGTRRRRRGTRNGATRPGNAGAARVWVGRAGGRRRPVRQRRRRGRLPSAGAGRRLRPRSADALRPRAATTRGARAPGGDGRSRRSRSGDGRGRRHCLRLYVGQLLQGGGHGRTTSGRASSRSPADRS